MRILVVDDDYVSVSKLKKLLSAYGDVDTAPYGDVALRMFEWAHKESVPYDLVTMDVEMPGMKGPEVVDKIREYEHAHSIGANDKVKILMVSVSYECNKVASSYAGGCDEYVTKFINPENLKPILQELGFIK